MVCDSDNKVLQKLQIYFKRCTGILPYSMVSLDSSRIVVLFFASGGLALLDALDSVDKNEIIEFIYSHQILSTDIQDNKGGFRGSNLIGCSSDPEEAKLVRSKYDGSHVTMVYSALSTLLLLGDNLSRVDRRGTLAGLSAMQCSDEPGLFKAGDICGERDMRFVFSAVASCYILNGLDSINCENVADFVAKCQTYQGGFANLPYLEAHAGATYCAVASLSLIGKLESVIPSGSKSRELLIKWLLNLQEEGFHGRVGKPDDTCYTFWVCASLKIGPFFPNVPTVVPLWVALFLRGQQKCRIMPPAWLTLEKLNECKEAEENDSGCTSPPHSQYIEISTLLLQHAAEDIPNPESIRNIVRDVWDIRVGKLLSSVNGFLSSGSSTARVSQLTNMELTTLHNLLANSMDQLSLLRQATSQAVEFGGSAVNRTSFLNSSSVGN